MHFERIKKLFVAFISCNVDRGTFAHFVFDILVDSGGIDSRCFELEVYFRTKKIRSTQNKES